MQDYSWSAARHRLVWVYDYGWGVVTENPKSASHFPLRRKIQVCQVCIKAHHDIYLAQGCAVAS